MGSQKIDNGMLGSKDYDLISLDLINSGGQVVPLKGTFIELQIFQDLYSPAMHGSILINDGNGTFTTHYYMGNEYLKIKIDKPGLKLPFDRMFRIYKVTDRLPAKKSEGGQSYILHFCSEEAISSQQILVSKAYKSAKIRDVVFDILTKELSVSPDRIASLELTSGNFDFIIPNYRPFEAIQWATARAYDQKKFCYFFFENKNGFNLTSLQTMIKQKPYKKLKFEVKNSDRDPSVNKNSVDDFEIVNHFDMMSSITNGAFSSRLMSIDIFSQSYQYNDYNLLVAEAQGNLINKYKPVNSFKNSKNQTLFDAYDGFFRTNLAISDTASEKSNDIKFWLQPRALHMTMLNHFRIKVVLPGDIELKVGDVVEYELPMFEAGNQSGKKIDKARTGKYLVAALNHKFSEDVFETIVELVSDSFSEEIPGAKEGLNKLSKKGK